MLRLSKIDQLINNFDQALRTVVPDSTKGTRPLPVSSEAQPELNVNEARHVAGLMRINHTGEVCAQALYQGQAATAKLPTVREKMQHSADEEKDHLEWCEIRLKELDSYPSILNPLWYGMSYGIGAVAGAISDEFSLGFVAETEAQVSKHLLGHIERLPQQDIRTKEILAQMNSDELEHREEALNAGGTNLPVPVKAAMTIMSKVMTFTTYRI